MFAISWDRSGKQQQELTYVQGRAKKNLAKFSDTCSVRADGLCIGSPRLVGGRKAGNSNKPDFLHHSVQVISLGSVLTSVLKCIYPPAKHTRHSSGEGHNAQKRKSSCRPSARPSVAPSSWCESWMGDRTGGTEESPTATALDSASVPYLCDPLCRFECLAAVSIWFCDSNGIRFLKCAGWPNRSQVSHWLLGRSCSYLLPCYCPSRMMEHIAYESTTPRSKIC